MYIEKYCILLDAGPSGTHTVQSYDIPLVYALLGF